MARGAEHRVDQVAVAVNRPVQIMPVAVDLHIRLVGVPRLACLPGGVWSSVAHSTKAQTALPTPAPVGIR